MKKVLIFLLFLLFLLLVFCSSCDGSVQENITTTLNSVQENITTTLNSMEEPMQTTAFVEPIPASGEEFETFLSPGLVDEGFMMIEFPHEGMFARHFGTDWICKTYYSYDGTNYSEAYPGMEYALYRPIDRTLTLEDFSDVVYHMTQSELFELVGEPNGVISGYLPFYYLSDGSYVVVMSSVNHFGYDVPGVAVSFYWGFGSVLDLIYVDTEGDYTRRGLSFSLVDLKFSEDYTSIAFPPTTYYAHFATYKPTTKSLSCNDLLVLEKNMTQSEIRSVLGEANGVICAYWGKAYPYYVLSDGTYAIMELDYGTFMKKIDSLRQIILLDEDGHRIVPWELNDADQKGRRFYQLPDGSYAMFKKEERSLTMEDFADLNVGMQTNAMFALVGNPDGYLVDTSDYLYRLDDGSFLILQMGLTKNEKNESINALTALIHLDENGNQTVLQ